MASFPSIYRARAYQINGLVIDVFVPQVFGETSIRIDTHLGNPPTETGLGWVMFQGGNPEFPVWAGNLTSIAPATPGTPPVPSGSVDEVWIGHDQPTDAAIELWYDPGATPPPPVGTWVGSVARVGVAGVSAKMTGGATTWAGGSTGTVGVKGVSGSFLSGRVWVGSVASIGVAGTSGPFVAGTRTWVGSTATIGVAGISKPFTGAPGNLLLPPSGKIYLGVDLPGRPGYLATGAKSPHISHDYSTSGSDFANDLNRLPTGMIQLENFKPLGAMGPDAYDDILAGLANSSIDQAATAIKNHGKPMFFSPMHEPENDDGGGGDADYAAAFRYIIERVRSQGATPVVVWNMMGFGGHGLRYDTLYPGNDVVDWIAWDPYVQTSTSVDTWKELIDVAGAGGFPGMYSWAAPKGKPIMLAEWGIGAAVAPIVAPKLLSRTQLDALKTNFPLVKALVYWNQPGVHNYVLANFPLGVWQTFTEQPEFNW